MLSFVNITTGWWSAPSFTIAKCAVKETSVDAFSASLNLHDYVALLYCDSMSHSHIILAVRCHITNWYCNSSDCHLCTTWGTLGSDSNNLCSLLQSEISMNSDPYKFFLNFPMAHITEAISTTKLCPDFSSGDNVDIEMEYIGCRSIPSRDLSNSHFLLYFSCASNFLASYEIYACRSTSPIPSLDQSVLVYNLLDGSGLDKLGPDKISFFNLSINLWSFGFHRFYISSIFSFWDSVPGWGWFDKIYF